MRLLLGLVMLGNLWVLFTPGSPQPAAPAIFTIPHLDKLIHVLIFAAPAFLVRRLTARWWPVALLTAHAVLSEYIQHWFIPLRGGDWRDAAADFVGIAAGVWIAHWWHGPAFRENASGLEE